MDDQLDALIGKEVHVTSRNFTVVGILTQLGLGYRVKGKEFVCIFSSDEVGSIEGNDVYLK